jgi:hypothetical protein
MIVLKFIPICFIFFFVCGVHAAEAFVPVLIKDIDQADIMPIADPTLAQAFYGHMDNFPHMYEIHAKEPFLLSLQILMPDIDSSKNNISGVIIKVPEGGGRVTEIASLSAQEAGWGTTFQSLDGNKYREGPAFQKELEPGMYRIEVHTPDNIEKYILRVGTRDEMTIGYIELLRRISEIQTFFGKSTLHGVVSPYLYVPLAGVIVSVVGLSVYIWRRRRKSEI